MSDSSVKIVAAAVGAAAAVGLVAYHLGKQSASGKSEKASPVQEKAGQAAAPSSSAPVSLPPRTPLMRPMIAPGDEKALRPQAIVVVDPVSTGANLASEVIERGIPCIRVFSRYVPPSLVGMVAAGLRSDFAATIMHDEADPNKTVKELYKLPFTIQAVIAGSELAIELADQLADKLCVRSNGAETSFLRRDKFQMGESVRRSRVRAVQQARVVGWDQVEVWLRRFKPNPFKVVIKPIRSAGSDNVYMCTSEAELKQRFNQIIGSTNQLGLTNGAVVVQEFLDGKEYVVDTVSRDGVHKMAAVWVYDKRPANGAPFVYFGMRMVDPGSEIAQTLFKYQRVMLDALNIMHGPAHAEIIYTKDGPCLVECGARPHGAEGTFIPIANACFGRNQVTMTVDAYTDEKKFLAYSDMPTALSYGIKVDLVAYVEGTLVAMPHLDKIRALKSFRSFDMMPKPGDKIKPTVDCFTAVGSVTLIHENKDQVEADYEAIRKLENDNFFNVRKE